LKIERLELFGSARLDFAAAHDVDLLVSFSSNAEWSLFDHVQMEQELSELLGRKVDLVSRRAIEASPNALRRSAILGSAVKVYGWRSRCWDRSGFDRSSPEDTHIYSSEKQSDLYR
jgi:predicted nucleotidyltransferase